MRSLTRIFRPLFRNSRGGFTLLETLVALIILTGGILVIANAWSGNAGRLSKAKINNVVATLLQRKMTEIEILYKDKPLTEVKENDSGDFGKDYSQYTWEMESKDFDMPDISGALTAREGGANEMLISMVQQITDYLKKAVKEVTVTIIYQPKKAKRPIRNSVTTYFVDYTQELSLGGIPGMGGAAGSGSGSGTGGSTGSGGASSGGTSTGGSH